MDKKREAKLQDYCKKLREIKDKISDLHNDEWDFYETLTERNCKSDISDKALDEMSECIDDIEKAINDLDEFFEYKRWRQAREREGK